MTKTARCLANEDQVTFQALSLLANQNSTIYEKLIYYLGGHGFNNRRGLRYFICPTLVTNEHIIFIIYSQSTYFCTMVDEGCPSPIYSYVQMENFETTAQTKQNSTFFISSCPRICFKNFQVEKKLYLSPTRATEVLIFLVATRRMKLQNSKNKMCIYLKPRTIPHFK